MFAVTMFAFANVLLAVFILAFALFSLRAVWGTKREGPWFLMVVLGLTMFVTQALNMLSLAGYFSFAAIRPFMDLIFLVLLLFTIVFQYHLITTSHKEHKKKK